MKHTVTTLSLPLIVAAAALLCGGPLPVATAEYTVSLNPVLDNTLFQYDPADERSTLNSNGTGPLFGAGVTFSRSQIQRGLVQFDLSSVPANAVIVPGSVQLRLYVEDSPGKDTTPRPFWLTRLQGLQQGWGEGTSGTTAGSGKLATAGDATWLHTQYDPDNPDANLWPLPGALGDGPVKVYEPFGGPAGIAGAEGTYVTLQSPSMETDLAAWLADPASNYGWVLIGDETIADADSSTKRGFGSRENTFEQRRPLLTFQYTEVPEPASVVLLGLGALLLVGICRRPRAA